MGIDFLDLIFQLISVVFQFAQLDYTTIFMDPSHGTMRLLPNASKNDFALIL